MFTHSQYYGFACNNKSDESSTVKNHPEADHMPSTTYTCEHCHDIFGNIIDLKCHIDSIHNKNDRSQQAGRFHFEENRKFDSTVSYQCQHCEKRYARPNDLECHISTCHIKSLEESSGEYECDLCDAEFACKSYLIRHNEAYHSANKIFPCHHCDHEFNQEDHLMQHTTECHRLRVECKVSGESISERGDLNMHNGKEHFDELIEDHPENSSILQSCESLSESESANEEVANPRGKLESTFFNPALNIPN